MENFVNPLWWNTSYVINNADFVNVQNDPNKLTQFYSDRLFKNQSNDSNN